MDSELRNRLWNELTIFYWSGAKKILPQLFESEIYPEMVKFMHALWHDYFKKPFDSLPRKWERSLSEIRQYYFNCEWFEVYDFMEFAANHYPKRAINKKFTKGCNQVLEEELSAYRFVSGSFLSLP